MGICVVDGVNLEGVEGVGPRDGLDVPVRSIISLFLLSRRSMSLVVGVVVVVVIEVGLDVDMDDVDADVDGVVVVSR